MLSLTRREASILIRIHGLATSDLSQIVPGSLLPSPAVIMLLVGSTRHVPAVYGRSDNTMHHTGEGMPGKGGV